MKPALKLGFTDTFGAIEEYFTEMLSYDFDVVRNDADPDYLIFGDRNFGSNNLNYDANKVTKIFFTGENQRPWDYVCHHAISFEHLDGPNYFRLPLYVIYDWDNHRKKVATSSYRNSSEYLTETLYSAKSEDRGFCSFVVKNPTCKMRNAFFWKLNTYKKVTSAGPLFNNTGFTLEGGANAVQAKLAFLPKFKFNLCFENASYPGYATEKMYEALIAGTVPIYWGSPTIEMDFNRKSFISWHDFQDDAELVQYIREVDNDKTRWIEYVTQPMWSESNKYMHTNRFRKWFRTHVYKGV